jgi:hypothetical protein
MLFIFIYIRIVTSYQLFVRSGFINNNKEEIICRLKENKLISCYLHTINKTILKHNYITLESQFNDFNIKKRGDICTVYWNENNNKWLNGIGKYELPKCVLNNNTTSFDKNFMCNFSKIIDIKHEFFYRDKSYELNNQRIFELAIIKEGQRVNIDHNLCVTNISCNEDIILTNEEIHNLFPNYKNLCERSRVTKCPKIGIKYFSKKVNHPCICYKHLYDCAFLSKDNCLDKSFISIPYIDPNRFKDLRSFCYNPKHFIPHEMGHHKLFEYKINHNNFKYNKFYLNCNNENEKHKFVNFIKKNSEIESDIFGFMTLLLNNNKDIAYQILNIFFSASNKNVHDFYFEETDKHFIAWHFSRMDFVKYSFHPSNILRFTYLKEFVVKFQAMLDYLYE